MSACVEWLFASVLINEFIRQGRMPALEKCFELFSDGDAFASLSKNSFGEKEEKPNPRRHFGLRQMKAYGKVWPAV